MLPQGRRRSRVWGLESRSERGASLWRGEVTIRPSVYVSDCPTCLLPLRRTTSSANGIASLTKDLEPRVRRVWLARPAMATLYSKNSGPMSPTGRHAVVFRPCFNWFFEGPGRII